MKKMIMLVMGILMAGSAFGISNEDLSNISKVKELTGNVNPIHKSGYEAMYKLAETDEQKEAVLKFALTNETSVDDVAKYIRKNPESDLAIKMKEEGYVNEFGTVTPEGKEVIEDKRDEAWNENVGSVYQAMEDKVNTLEGEERQQAIDALDGIKIGGILGGESLLDKAQDNGYLEGETGNSQNLNQEIIKAVEEEREQQQESDIKDLEEKDKEQDSAIDNKVDKEDQEITDGVQDDEIDRVEDESKDRDQELQKDIDKNEKESIERDEALQENIDKNTDEINRVEEESIARDEVQDTKIDKNTEEIDRVEKESVARDEAQDVKIDKNTQEIDRVEKESIARDEAQDEIIKENTEDIATNKENIETNTGNIADNKKAIEKEAVAREEGDAKTLKASKSYTDTKASETLSSANSYTDQRINSVNNKIDDLEDEMHELAAQQAAMLSAGLAAISNLEPGDLGIGGGVGHNGGATAGAISLGYLIDEDLSTNMSVSFSSEADATFGAGFGYRFSF